MRQSEITRLTGETDILEFPFTLRGGHAVFRVMEPIY